MANWQNFPFTLDGVNFNSRVDLDSTLGKSISKLPTSIFNQMNQGAIRSLLGDVSAYTKDKLVSELATLNSGGSQAFIELA